MLERNLCMSDRSISALRTLRPDSPFDRSIFWFRDDLHQPYPISPMGMTTIQAHHAWGYHVASEKIKLPTSKGAHVKIHQGRVYLGFAIIDDPKETATRESEFIKLVEYCLDHWEDYYNEYIQEVTRNLDTVTAVNTEKLLPEHLLEHLKKAEEINRRNWEIHFTLMYPADAVYFMFENYCGKHGWEEQQFILMLKGFDSIATQTDQELWNLTKLTEIYGIKDIIVNTGSDRVLEKLGKIEAALPWLDSFRQFLSVYGNRVVAAHLDVTTPTWQEDPTPVLDTIKSYYARMESGWDFDEAKQEVLRQKNRAIDDFEKILRGKKDKKIFRRLLKAAQAVYAFQEDHGFYIDQGSTAAMRNAIISCGRRLYEKSLIPNIEDVTFLTFYELAEVLDRLVANETVACYHYSALIPDLVRERKRDAETAAINADAPLTLGTVPEKMTDPIGTKVFGIIDTILHPKGEKNIVERLEGFPGSPGVAEGRAKIVLNYQDFQKIESGEILICPYTGTAWTPLFVKIAGVVTDTGGMLTHAAIAAREYNIPAVVGTWNATNSISDGDLIRINGTAGVVEVLERAATP